MSDAVAPPRRTTRDQSRVVVDVNRDLFLASLAAKGATTGDERAQLLATSRRMVERYADGKVEPKLTTARRIAKTLGRDVDELWPASSEAAA
jgi:DNA-binding XRE family transcriptional regulator